MSPQLQTYADAHRQSQTEAHRVAANLSDEAFNWKTDEASWSVGECLVHLNVVAEAYLPKLEAAVGAGARRAEGPFTYGFMTRKMIDGVRPGGPALSTSRSLNPSKGGARSEIDRADALTSFDGYVRQYVAVCEAAEGLDLARIKVRYPFFWLLRLPLGAFLEITEQHALRHVQQAERVTERPGFPT